MIQPPNTDWNWGSSPLAFCSSLVTRPTIKSAKRRSSDELIIRRNCGSPPALVSCHKRGHQTNLVPFGCGVMGNSPRMVESRKVIGDAILAMKPEKVAQKWLSEEIFEIYPEKQNRTKTLHLLINNGGAPGRTRTCNPLIRSQMLYPIELRMQPEICQGFANDARWRNGCRILLSATSCWSTISTEPRPAEG